MLRSRSVDHFVAGDSSCEFRQPPTDQIAAAAAAAEMTTTILMGHSFGDVKALTAARPPPQLDQTILAHEPAIEWFRDSAHLLEVSLAELETATRGACPGRYG